MASHWPGLQNDGLYVENSSLDLLIDQIKNQEMILENCRGSYNTIPQPEAMYGQGGPGLVHILVHGAAFPALQDHHHHEQPRHHHH